jgi:hypothetical protein
MSETEKSIEIDVAEAEKPDVAVETAEKPAEKAVAPEISPEEGIETFKRQLEAEKLARIEAERRAEAATRAVYEARGQVEDSNLQIVSNAIDTLKRETEILKANLRNAMAAGDHDAAADAQEAMADAKAKLLQLENGKAAMQEQAKQPRAPIERVAAHDPVEALASQLSPRSAAWVRAHPEYARNERLTQKMIAAHNLITADGVQPDTDEYFESVERVLGVQPAQAPATAAAEAPMSAASAPTQRRSSPAAAPVSRSGNGTGGGRSSTVITLTPQEREMASIMRMSDEEYAKNKHALIREGKLTKH